MSRRRAKYSRDDCQNELPHTRKELFDVFTSRFLTSDRFSRICRYGLCWEVYITTCHARGDLYWDYRNGQHPADSVLKHTNALCNRLDKHRDDGGIPLLTTGARSNE